MSFWPKWRRRCRSRKRVGKANPYATRDIDRYSSVHAEIEAQRAEFAAEKGVPVSVVRFISRSSRGWVHLPDYSPKVSSDVGQDSSSSSLTSPSDQAEEFVLPPPTLPLPNAEVLNSEEGTPSDSRNEVPASSSTSSAGNHRGSKINLDLSGLVSSGKAGAWMLMRKSAVVLFVNVLVVSRALGVSTAFAFTIGVVVSTWSRGKKTSQRVFSALATQLLTSLRPFLSLLQAKSVRLIRARKAQSPIALSEMKVLPITESDDGVAALESRSSSFAFPAVHVVTGDPSEVSGPIFPNSGNSSPPQQECSEVPVKVGSPLVESNKFPSPKACQKLRSKLFKSSPGRKASYTLDGENSSPTAAEAESRISASSSAPSSPSAYRKRSSPSFISRKSNKSKMEIGGDEAACELESYAKPKTSRSHELFFGSPNRKQSPIDVFRRSVSPPAGRKNVSRSQEMRFSLKSFGKRKGSKSHELSPSSSSSPPADIQELMTLPSSTVEGLEALAFPFRMDEQIQLESPSESPSRDRVTSRRNSLGKMISMESSEEKSTFGKSAVEIAAPLSPRASKAVRSTQSRFSCTMEKATVSDLKPELRKVRTAVSPSTSRSDPQAPDLRKSKAGSTSRTTPLPAYTGELGRSKVLSPETLGSLLLLAVLGFLLLGRISAILGTSCFCLVLSHVQGFIGRNLTKRDKELLRRGSALLSGQGHGDCSGLSPSHGRSLDFQSSEYRKRVLIEGLLDRGNRRGSL